MCLEVPDCDFLVTNRSQVPWPFEQSTVGMCLLCYIKSGMALGEALQSAIAESEASAGPGVLEQIEQAEALGTPTAAKGRKRGAARKSEPAPEQEPQIPQEAEASHD